MQHFQPGTSTPVGALVMVARPAPDWQCEIVLHLISHCYNVPLRLILHPSRCMKATARARQVAMYLAHVVLGRAMSEVAALFGRDRTTVSHACARIEDMRDDTAFDAELSALERQIEVMLETESRRGRRAAG